MGKSQELYQEAKGLIPGGTQLLSKRPEMFLPEKWPAYYSKAKGAKVWDLDGKGYIDVSLMGIGANVLGYADETVDQAVKEVIDASSMCTLNAPEEVELAKLLLDLHPWADMVRYAKTGGEALALAIRIARAYTQKDTILFCGYHGWSDWYIAANLGDNTALDGQHIVGLQPKGVPKGLTNTVIPFKYNDIEAFQRLIHKHKGKIAAVIMEPVRNHKPKKGFLEAIREITIKQHIIFVLDEVSSGFRLNCGGAHMVFGIEPDIAVFAKAMSNGYPMSAVIGKKYVMDSAQDTFISSTYWTERIGLKAAIATIKKYQKYQVDRHLEVIGKKVQEAWITIANKTKLKVNVTGIYPLSHFDFIHKNPLVLKTLFTQEMLKRGFLATNSFYVSYAHDEELIEDYLGELEEVFFMIANLVKVGKEEEKLESSICQTGFQRLN